MSFGSRKHRIGLLLGALVPVFLLLAEGAAAQGAILRWAPEQATVGAGQTAAVEVWAENVTDLYGLDMHLSFDPTAVRIVDADPAAEGIQVRPGDLLQPDLVIRNTADNDRGTLWFALTQINPSPEVSGSGVVCVILFEGLKLGATSPLTVVEATLATRSGQALPVALHEGQMRVVGQEEAPPTPTPAPTLPPPTLILPTPEPTPTSTALPLLVPSSTPAPAHTATLPTIAGMAGEDEPTRPAEQPGEAQASPVPAGSSNKSTPPPSARDGPSLLPIIALVAIVLLLAGLIWRARRGAARGG